MVRLRLRGPSLAAIMPALSCLEHSIELGSYFGHDVYISRHIGGNAIGCGGVYRHPVFLAPVRIVIGGFF